MRSKLKTGDQVSCVCVCVCVCVCELGARDGGRAATPACLIYYRSGNSMKVMSEAFRFVS